MANSVDMDVPAVLLVGGLGTRLQKVLLSAPKPLARVGETAFLELLVLQLRSQGVRRLIMCTGHLADQIESAIGDGSKWGVAIEYSREIHPLGTGGAVKLAERHLRQAPHFFVMNGDSFLEMDFGEFMRFHLQHRGLLSMAVRRVPDTARYGRVQLDSSSRIIAFHEKNGSSGPGIVNGGVYAFSHSMLRDIPDGPSSLEKDLLPQLLHREIYGFEQNGIFIDIGTPDDYARAQSLSRTLLQAATSRVH